MLKSAAGWYPEITAQNFKEAGDDRIVMVGDRFGENL